MPRWAAPCRKRRHGELPITKRGGGSDAIAVRSSTEPALLGLRRGQGSTWGTRRSVAGGSQRGRVCTQPHPAGWEWGGRRRREQWPEWVAHSRCRRGFVGRMGVKRPETGSKRRFLGEYATWPITAQLLFQNTVMSRVAVHPSPDMNRSNLIEHINLRRKHGAANSGKSRKT